MDRLRRFAENTTVHGLKDFLRIDYTWARCLWTGITLSCFAMMIYETHQLLMQYTDEPTATQVQQKYFATYPYPRMIFCPNKWINASRVAELKIPKPILIYALSLLRRVVLDGKEKEEVASNISAIREEFEEFLRKQRIHSYIDFFLEIANDPFQVSSCDQCEIIVNQVVASGVCVHFRPFDATSDQLIKLPPTYRFVDSKNNIDQQHSIPFYAPSYAADSIYVSFRPHYDFFAYDPTLLNRGYSYILRIKPTNYRRLNRPPDRRCASTEKVKNERYSQLMCYSYCDEKYKSSCRGCHYLSYDYNIVIPRWNNNSSESLEQTGGTLPPCSSLLFDPLDNDSCADRADADFVRCVKSCEPLCDEWVYETTAIPVAQPKLITVHKPAVITITLSYQVRYGETFIEEVSTYSWETFVSNIGGQLGLWLGASVVSLLQLLHFLAELFYYDLNPFKRRPRNQSTTTSDNSNETPAQRSPTQSSVYTTRLSMYDWSFRSAFHQRRNNNGIKQARRSSLTWTSGDNRHADAKR